MASALSELFSYDTESSKINFQRTNKEFQGDFTLVVFPFIKASKKSPEETGKAIGDYLVSNSELVDSYNVVKGFLNLSIKKVKWAEFFTSILPLSNYGEHKRTETEPVVVEYSSPNTNKPLHLGHVRNNLLGFSLYRILSFAGYNVKKVNLVNDRGIHICKSMLAWEKFGNGETPASSGMKGDHLVGKYYVEFDKAYKKDIEGLVSSGMSKETAEKEAPLMKECQEMLRLWEAGDEKVLATWKMMNGWVYEGFSETYKTMGVDFDKIYYESETYLLGKKIVEKGLKDGVFFKKEDGSTWIDLTNEGLDQKVLLRSDGTSVYMTQDLGTAVLRYDEFGFSRLIYVVGNEQDYHFKALKIILKKAGYDWAEGLSHFSYGMVELPQGKMKSREGTVVDADDLMSEMIETARRTMDELGKVEGLAEEEKEELSRMIGMGALKYFILKVDPKKKMMFNPEESIDFNGNTGPFIQFNYVRTQALQRKAVEKNLSASDIDSKTINLTDKERDLILLLYKFPFITKEAADTLSPAVISNYVYELAKEYSQFYHETPILTAETENAIRYRLALSNKCGQVIKSGMSLLGIEVPERM